MPAPSRVADILMEQGRQAGEAARAKGQIWGSTVQRLGEIPGEAIQQQARQKQQAQELAIGGERLQQFQHARQGQDLTKKLVTANAKMVDGHLVYDHEAIANGLRTGGFEDAADHYMDIGTKLEDSIARTQTHKLAYEASRQQTYADVFGAVASVPKEKRPEAYAVWHGALSATAKQDPVFGSLPSVYPGDDAFDAMYQSHRTDAQRLTMRKEAAAEAKERRVTVGYGQKVYDVGDEPGAKPTLLAEGAPDPLKGIFPVGPGGLTKVNPDGTVTQLAPGSEPAKHFEAKSVYLDGKPAEVRFDPSTGKYLDASGADISARVKPTPPASTIIMPGTALSDDALTMAARRYLTDGTLPAIGRGNAGQAQRTAIMNAAAKIDPVASITANKATYKADTANLVKLQTTEGTLSAFEKTAGKNLDQFLSLADKIPDTGVPWLNTPVRQLTVQMVGSANMAAINAARDVALREIARVTNDPKLSGALTDSARAEVLGLIPANATLPQIRAVARVLKTDMANVHAGVNEQITIVKAGLSGHPGAPPAAAVPANVAKALKGASAGKHTLSDGSVWMVDASGTITK